jgi:hypothetical protein
LTPRTGTGFPPACGKLSGNQACNIGKTLAAKKWCFRSGLSPARTGEKVRPPRGKGGRSGKWFRAGWLGLDGRRAAAGKGRRHRTPQFGIANTVAGCLTRTYYRVREGPVPTALWKQDGIRIKAARLANRRWAKTRCVAIKICFRLWNDPASRIKNRVKIAIRGPGNFHGGHQSRPWSQISGVRDADACPRHAGDAPKCACPKSVEFRHFCLRHGSCFRRNRPCPAGLRVPSIV